MPTRKKTAAVNDSTAHIGFDVVITYGELQRAVCAHFERTKRARKERLRRKHPDQSNSTTRRLAIMNLAQQYLEIGLDNSVKTIYFKFEGAVQSIPGLEAKED